jgi:hypothetical protein
VAAGNRDGLDQSFFALGVAAKKHFMRLTPQQAVTE